MPSSVQARQSRRAFLVSGITIQNQQNNLPWTEVDEAFVKKTTAIIEETLNQARTLPDDEWQLVPVEKRCAELASVILFASKNRHPSAP